MVTGNYEVVKSVNTSLVLDALRQHEELSRAEIARMTGLTTGTITNIVKTLLEYGLVEEIGSGASIGGGRKPIILKLNPEGGYAIGIELSTLGIKAILVNLLAEPLTRLEKPGVFRYQQGLEAITEMIEILKRSLGDARAKLLGIGVSVPGWVHFSSGKIRNLPNLPGWENTYIKKDLEKIVHLPVLIDNDANLAAQGEVWFGQDKSLEQLIYILVNDGVGAGLVFHHQIYHGNGYSVGELGHISFGFGDEICQCGKTGCLDTMVAAKAIEKKYHRITGKKQSLEEIKQYLQLGDEQARHVMMEAADTLGRGISTLINLCGPDTIILGGRVIRENRLFFEAVKEATLKYALPIMSQEVLITSSRLDEESSILGSVALVFQSVLQPYSLYALGKPSF